MTRTWITARLEDGKLRVTASAAHDFGSREAVVHADITDHVHDVREALAQLLKGQEGELIERAEEASYVHRIRARELGEDVHAPLTVEEGGA